MNCYKIYLQLPNIRFRWLGLKTFDLAPQRASWLTCEPLIEILHNCSVKQIFLILLFALYFIFNSGAFLKKNKCTICSKFYNCSSFAPSHVVVYSCKNTLPYMFRIVRCANRCRDPATGQLLNGTNSYNYENREVEIVMRFDLRLEPHPHSLRLAVSCICVIIEARDISRSNVNSSSRRQDKILRKCSQRRIPDYYLSDESRPPQ